jgi:hypothetical protein
MNDWSRTRKRIILLIVFSFLAILVAVPFFLLVYEKPTCMDNKRNGDETGVDCGGSCQRLCTPEALPLILKGDPRVLIIAPNTYEIVGLVGNPNPGAEIYRAKYTVKIYDSVSALPIKTIDGSAHIPKGRTVALFEGPFTLPAEVAPTRATLEWQEMSLDFRKTEVPEPEIEVFDLELANSSSSPRLTAKVENLSLGNVSNIDFVALISDAGGNIFAASKTYIDSLEAGETADIFFAWPRPFSKQAANTQIIERVLPDRSFIR